MSRLFGVEQYYDGGVPILTGYGASYKKPCGFQAKLAKPACPLVKPPCGGAAILEQPQHQYIQQQQPCHEQYIGGQPVVAAAAAPVEMMTTKTEKMVQKKSSSWLWWIAGIVAGLLLLWLAWALLKNQTWNNIKNVARTMAPGMMGPSTTPALNVVPAANGNAVVVPPGMVPADVMAAAVDTASASAAMATAAAMCPQGASDAAAAMGAGMRSGSPMPYLTPNRPYVSPPQIANAIKNRNIAFDNADGGGAWVPQVCCEDEYRA